MPAQTQLIPDDDFADVLPHANPRARSVGGVTLGADGTLRADLLVSDDEVVRIIAELPPAEQLEFLTRALKVGVLVLRDQRTISKADYVDKEFARLRAEFAQQMQDMFGERGQVSQKLQDMFGDDGAVERKMQAFFGSDGRFESVMDEFLGEEGLLRQSVEDAVGEEGMVHRTLDGFLGEDGQIHQAFDQFLGERGRLHQELERVFGTDGGRLYTMLDPASEDTPLGKFRRSLEAKLDPEKEGSLLWQLKDEMRTQFRDIKEGLGILTARAEEREKGSLKGLDFQDQVLAVIERTAEPFGDRVDDTSRDAGPLGDVGDAVVQLDVETTGGMQRRIAIEAKNTPVTLKGKASIYKELDRAMENRDACFAIAAVRSDHATKFEPLRYVAPNHLLVAVEQDDDDALALRVAYRFARSIVAARAGQREATLDVESVLGRLREVRSQLEHLQALKRTLTSAASSIEGVKDGLDGMRSAILETVATLEGELHEPPPAE